MLGGIAATLIWLSAYQPHGGLVNAGLVGPGGALHWDWLRSFADYPWLSERAPLRGADPDLHLDGVRL